MVTPQKMGKSLHIALNKTDLLTKNELVKCQESLEDKLKFGGFIGATLISCKSQKGIKQLARQIKELAVRSNSQISTGNLTKITRELVMAHPLPRKMGRSFSVKIRSSGWKISF